MTDFNRQIDIPGLPRVEELEFIPLEKAYLSVLLWKTTTRVIIFSLLILVLMVVFISAIPPALLGGIPVFLLLYIIWAYVSTIYGFRYKSYALRGRDINYRTGWLWRSVITASFNRVQHVEIEQGFIERQFNLAKLKVYTAGGSSSDISIPGLRPAVAKSLKEFIVGRTHEDEEQ